MRHILLAAALTLSTVSAAQAVTIPTLSYPEPGTFCGFMTLCGPDTRKAEAPASEK
jgi:hypothetical protein